MSVTPLRSHADMPASQSANFGIMPDLYRLSVGPVGAAYYQKHFLRFETLGKAVPCWNPAAAFFTLAWMVLRKLWLPAAVYLLVLAGVLAVWWWGLHDQVPLAIEASIGLLLTLLMCIVPGFIGTGLYYQHVCQQTLHTLKQAPSLAQARLQLAENAIAPERLRVIASVQALVALLLVAALLYMPSQTTLPTPDTASTPSGSGPQLVIPSVESIRAKQWALPTVEPSPSAEPLPAAPSPIQSLEALALTTQGAADSEHSASRLVTPAPTPHKHPTETDIETTAPAAPASPSSPQVKADGAVSKKPTTLASPTNSSPKAATAEPATSEPATATAKAKTAPITANQLITGKYYLNAGVYAQINNVNAAERQLHQRQLSTVRQTIRGKNRELTRLYIGPFEQRQQAEQAAIQAKKLNLEAQILRAR